MKLFGATVLLGTMIFVNDYSLSKIKKRQGPDLKIMKTVPMIVCLSLVLVLLGVAITTTVSNRMDYRIDCFLGSGFRRSDTSNDEVNRAALA